MVVPRRPPVAADLASVPAAANAVAWSEDNLLAVATGRSVILLSAAALHGPRAVIDIPFTQATEADAPMSTRLEDHVAFGVGSAGRGPKPELRKSSTVRVVAWSPAGADAAGGCLLAVVTQDHKVLICGPPASAFSSHWQVLTDLTARLRKEPKAAAWLAALQQQEPASGETLRLRGGGRRKQPPVVLPPASPQPDAALAAAAAAAATAAAASGEPACAAADTGAADAAAGAADQSAAADAAAVGAATPPPAPKPRKRRKTSAPAAAPAAPVFRPGDAVEVTNDEDGLRGCWFEATVREVQQGFALVEYAELMVAEDSNERLQEWFPLRAPAGATEAAALEAAAEKLQSDAEAHTRQGFVLRPAPPNEMCERGKPRSAGDAVDIWEHGGWWRGHVTAFDSAGTAGTGDENAAPRLRVAPEAGGNDMQAAQADCRTALHWDGAKWVPAAAAAAAAAAVAAAQPTNATAAPPSASAAGSGSGSGGGSSGSGGQQPPKPRKRQQLGKAAAAAQVEPYQVPEGFSAADLGGDVDAASEKAARLSAAQLCATRFLALRAELPVGQRPTYESTGEHLRGADEALWERVRAEVCTVHGAALEAAGVAEKRWLTAARDRLRRVWNRHEDPNMERLTMKAAAATPAASGARGGAGGAAKAPGTGSKRPANQPEPYVVPPDFDPSALVAVDFSDDAAAKHTLPWAFLQRWLALRDQVPEEERPTYVKGQHLRGVDNDNAERCRAEIMHVHGAAMAERGLDEKFLLKEGKALIRLRVIKTRFAQDDAPAAQDSDGATPVPEELPSRRKRKAVLSPEAAAAAISDDGSGGGGGSSSGSDFNAELDTAKSSSPSSRDVSMEAESDGAVPSADEDTDEDADGGGGAPAKRRKRSATAAQASAGRKFEAANVPRGPRPPPLERRPPGRPRSAASVKKEAAAEAPLPRQMAAVSAAWSPVIPAAATPASGTDPAGSSAGCGGAVLLAVGTAGGLVWLWRLQLPAAYTLQQTAGLKMELAGVLRVGSCPVASLAWASAPATSDRCGSSTAAGSSPMALVLAAGCADGGVRVFGGAAAALSSALGSGGSSPYSGGDGGGSGGGSGATASPAQPQVLLRPLGQAVAPDLRGVISLAAACQLGLEGAGELTVAAGKHAGVLALWRGRLNLKGAELHLQEEGSLTVMAHGSATVTSVALAAGVASTCGAEGGLGRWDATTGAAVSPDGLAQSTALQLPAADADTVAVGATGLAVSPGGLCAAIVRTTFGVPVSRRLGPKKFLLGTVELRWLGGDALPGGTPALAARLPWLQLAAARVAGSGGGGAGGGDAGDTNGSFPSVGDAGGSSGGGSRKKKAAGDAGAAQGRIDAAAAGAQDAAPPACGASTSAAALWEAAAALAGVEGGAPLLPSRHAAEAPPRAPLPMHISTRVAVDDEAGGEDVAPDAAAADDLQAEGVLAAVAGGTAAELADAEAEAAAQLSIRAEALDDFLGGVERASAASDNASGVCPRGLSTAAALRHMLSHLLRDGPSQSKLAQAEEQLLQAHAAGAADPGAQASCGGSEGAALVELSRRAATQRAIGAASAWGCGVCGRRYAAPPGPPGAGSGPGGAVFAPGLPRCLVCGVRVARVVPPTVLPEVGL